MVLTIWAGGADNFMKAVDLIPRKMQYIQKQGIY